MSLLGSIQMAGNTLQAMQIGLQVVGQNIANANTPGYVREEANFVTAPTYQYGGITLGLGVRVTGVLQKIDRFIEDRSRGAASDRASAEAQEQAFAELEGLLGELNDTDLSTSMSNFFNSIHEVLNQPNSDAARNLAILRGQTLSQDVNNLASRTITSLQNVNDEVIGSANEINRLLDRIGRLNVQVAQVEASGAAGNDAAGVRDQRADALKQLSELINVQVSEDESGAVNVLQNGEFLVAAGLVRPVAVVYEPSRGANNAYLEIAETHSRLTPTGGKLAGLISGRDDVLGGFVDQLDQFAQTLAFEFNKIFSSGQGLNGYQSVTASNAIDNTGEALDSAGLPFTPVNGSFEIQVYTPATRQTTRTRVAVDLNGLGDDTTLDSLAATLDAIAGVSASITSTGKLQIGSETSEQQIAFADDTSGVLAALGINTFFTGSTALDLAVNQAVIDDPKKFAASQNGIGEDTENAIELADFGNRQLASQGSATLTNLYDRLVGGVTEAAAVAKSAADGFRSYEQSVAGQQLAVSGVSIDEETIKLLGYQRTYQASAKYITALNELLDSLLAL